MIPEFPQIRPIQLEDRNVLQETLWKYQPQPGVEFILPTLTLRNRTFIQVKPPHPSPLPLWARNASPTGGEGFVVSSLRSVFDPELRPKGAQGRRQPNGGSEGEGKKGNSYKIKLKTKQKQLKLGKIGSIIEPWVNHEEEKLALFNAFSMPDIKDKGGRRSGNDRRRFSISGFTPEMRSNQDRRTGEERRSGKDSGDSIHLKRNIDRFMEFAKTQKGIFLAILLSLPLWALIIFFIIKG